MLLQGFSRRRLWDVAPSDRRAERRVHRRGLGCAGRRPPRRSGSACPTSPTAWPPSWPRWAWGGRTSRGCRSAVLALELHRRHRPYPRSLALLGAYAGWAGSLPPEAVRRRLRESLRLAELPVEEFVRAMLPTMFSPSAAPERVGAFAARMAGFQPDGFRVMARSSAEADLREGLARIDVPTLLLYGDAGVRAPLAVAEALHAAIPGRGSSCWTGWATPRASRPRTGSPPSCAPSSARPPPARSPGWADDAVGREPGDGERRRVEGARAALEDHLADHPARSRRGEDPPRGVRRGEVRARGARDGTDQRDAVDPSGGGRRPSAPRARRRVGGSRARRPPGAACRRRRRRARSRPGRRGGSRARGGR